jgi:trk system potassium uptake protein TrkA
MLRRISPAGAESEWTDASGTVRLAEVHVAPTWIGHLLTRIEALTPARVAFLTRLGEGMIPGPETVLQEGDLLHVLARADDMAAIAQVLDQPPPHEEH